VQYVYSKPFWADLEYIILMNLNEPYYELFQKPPECDVTSARNEILWLISFFCIREELFFKKLFIILLCPGEEVLYTRNMRDESLPIDAYL